MKKIIIIAVLSLLQATAARTQITPDPAKAAIKKAPATKAPVKSQTTRTMTMPMSQTPPVGPNSGDFYLTSAKATIYTGNDNKEKPSQVQMQLSLGTQGVGNYMVPTLEYKEFAVNSATELPFKFDYSQSYYYRYLCLTNVETAGAKMFIYYSPNFPLDAWKIDKVILTLEFRDGNGKLHPTLGTKSIVFMNVGALLNNGHHGLVCEADRFLMPVSATVKE